MTSQQEPERCLHVLHVGVLLDHAELLLMQEGVNVRALFDEPGAEVLVIVGLNRDQNVENHIEKDISVLDLADLSHQAHHFIDDLTKCDHFQDWGAYVPYLFDFPHLGSKCVLAHLI